MKLYLGIMSGTSLDGVDLALVDFENGAKLEASRFVSMPEALRADLSVLLKSGETSLQKLGEIDYRLGVLYADCVNEFLSKNQLKPSQIEDMNVVSARTGITTIADFRRKDMAFGGQGAPLVPAFHEAIFARPNQFTVVLNIGGISNISVLKPNAQTIGYDVSVGNALMDSWIEKHLGKRYDKNAEWAKTGKVIPEFLAEMLSEPFLQLPPPKSTGRELFNLAWLEKQLANLTVKSTAYKVEDVQRTLAEFTAQSVSRELSQWKNEPNKVLLVCGGGARNPLLMERFNALLPDWCVGTTNDDGVNVDYVEAAAFAWLAYCRMENLPSNMPSVTGSSQAVSLGVIFPK